MIDINLVAERQRERRARERMARVALLLALAFLVATGAVGTWLITQRSGARAEIAKQESLIEDLRRQKAEIDQIKQDIERKRPLVELLNGARTSELRWCRTLRDLSHALPAGVQLESVRSAASIRPRVREAGTQGAQEGGPGVSIMGAAQEQHLVGLFMTNLGREPSFSETYLSYSRARRQGEVETYGFEITAMLSPELGGGSE